MINTYEILPERVERCPLELFHKILMVNYMNISASLIFLLKN